MHSHNLLKHPYLEDHILFYFSHEKITFFTIDCESLPDNAPCLRPLPQFEATPPQDVSMLTSYHGLVCLGINNTKQIMTYFCNSQYADIILWNPLTTEYKRLSKPSNPDHMECYNIYGCGYGLYYGSCKDDIKLLVLKESGNVYIYSLKSDSWRKLYKKAPFKVTNCWRQGLCWEKNLYFLLHKRDPSLIRFDIKSERFHKIEFPHKYDTTYIPGFVTTVHRGSIHLCVIYDILGRPGFVQSTHMELWKFNADEDIWSKVVTYQFGPKNDIGNMFPLHLVSNGNWLMKDYREKGRILQVELKKKYTEDRDGHDEYKFIYFSVEGIPQQVRYTETFVSPNQYMK